jgi:hypothetical protein
MGRLGRAALLVGLGAFGPACDEPSVPDAEAERFAGSVSGAGVVIGALADERGGQLYVCGHDEATRALSEWLTIDETGELVSKDGSAVRGQAALSDGEISGSVVLRDGREIAFSIPAVTSPELGLFAVVDQGCRAGLVLYDGGAAGTWCSSDGRFEQVTPIAPLGDHAWQVRIHDSPMRELRFTAVELAARL